ncbi:MAG: hypothetical protein WC356_01135 [Candidatus Micrarchaeia archaeon]|jgi:predicted transcriptional regulator of viral defense system
MKYSLEIFKSKKYPVFTFKDIKQLKIPKNYAKQLMYNKIKRGEVKRIKKGYYTFHEDPMIVVFAYEPAYLGLESALSIHKVWDQKTVPVIITQKNVRQGIRKFNNTNYVVKRIAPSLFTDYTTINYYGFWLPVSTLEKTYEDIKYFNEKIDPKTMRKLKKLIKKNKLKK